MAKQQACLSGEVVMDNQPQECAVHVQHFTVSVSIIKDWCGHIYFK
jgi:hypothetical protein